jgi:hypothetical protein
MEFFFFFFLLLLSNFDGGCLWVLKLLALINKLSNIRNFDTLKQKKIN